MKSMTMKHDASKYSEAELRKSYKLAKQMARTAGRRLGERMKIKQKAFHFGSDPTLRASRTSRRSMTKRSR